MSGLWRFILKWVRSYSGTKVGFTIQRLAYSLYRESCNPGYIFSANGELRVLRAITQANVAGTVFDVGANSGHWTLACVAGLSEKGNIYSFEPGNLSFEKLTAAVQQIRNAHPFQLGLSSAESMMDILISDSVSEKSSVEAEAVTQLHSHISDYRKEKQRFVRGDDFCEKHNVDRINLLKIDTEGHDLKVLAGFREMISGGKIEAIQFEYNRMAILTKSLLRDFYDLLNTEFTKEEYLMGRIYPNGVWFKPYDVLDENFVDGNFIAVRRESSALIELLEIWPGERRNRVFMTPLRVTATVGVPLSAI